MQLTFLSGAPPEALARLAAYARWVDVSPEMLVMDFEETTTDVFFIMQGAVRVLVRTADGVRTQILGEFLAGDLVGEMSAIDDAPRSARVEALVRTRLCIVPAAAFLELTFTAPAVALRLLRRLTMRIRGQNRRMLEHTALPIRLRLAAELLRLSRARPDGTRSLSPPPIQEELGDRIGARRESVSRELAVLARAGLLQRKRSAYVLTDPAALQSIVEAGLSGLSEAGTHRR
jgi:CRP/FNR family transcriptional regulator, cyclic AMP receptor protein